MTETQRGRVVVRFAVSWFLAGLAAGVQVAGCVIGPTEAQIPAAVTLAAISIAALVLHRAFFPVDEDRDDPPPTIGGPASTGGAA